MRARISLGETTGIDQVTYPEFQIHLDNWDNFPVITINKEQKDKEKK